MTCRHVPDVFGTRPAPFLRSSGLCALFVVALCGWAQAYINVGYSVEWLCRFSPVVVHARVLSVANNKTDAEFQTADLECEVIATLKGKAEDRIRFEFAGYGPAGAKGTEYLLFLRSGEKGLTVTYWINLQQPATRLSRGVAYTKTGDVMTDGAKILALAKERVALKAPKHEPSDRIEGWPGMLYVSAPGASAQSLWAGSVCYLCVPPDPEFKKEFVDRCRREGEKAGKSLSDDIYVAKTLLALSYFPDDDVVALLKEALADGRSRRIRLKPDRELGEPGGEFPLYVIRQAAYECLLAMGRNPAKPEHFSDKFHLDVGPVGHSWGFRDPTNGKSSYLRFDEIK